MPSELRHISQIFINITSYYYYIIMSNLKSINVFSYKELNLNNHKMKNIQKMASVVPFGEQVLEGAEGIYQISKSKTLSLLKNTKGKVALAQDQYYKFRDDVDKFVKDTVSSSTSHVLDKFQDFLGIQTQQEKQQVKERLLIILSTLYQNYLVKNKLIQSQRVQGVLQKTKKYSTQQIIPMYINLKATLIVSRQMFVQFVQSFFSQVKLTYESSKDHVVMFIGGNFTQEKIKKMIQKFKNFTIEAVHRGVEIKIDRSFIVENYDNIAVRVIQIVKELREKGEQNYTEIKNKSKDLYKEAIKRIKAKQLQLKVNEKLQKEPTTEKVDQQ